jgi:hypothetical protein
LLLRRDFDSTIIKEGEKLTVTVEVHNAGAGAATDVSVSDAEWDPVLFSTEGDISAEFDSIPAGATKAYSFLVIPSVPLNRFEQPELTISYKSNGRAITSQGPKEFLKVHSKDELFRKKLFKFGALVTLGAVRDEQQWLKAAVFVAGAIALYVIYNLVMGTKTTLSDAKRKRALKEFGFKDE